MLNELNNNRKKTVEVKLNWAEEVEPIIVVPKQFLEEDYVSYLVEVAEPNSKYDIGDLIEIREGELEYVKPYDSKNKDIAV